MSSEIDDADDAVQIVRLLAEPERLRVAAAIVLGHTRLSDIAAASGVDERAVARALARLVGGGLVVQEDGIYRFAVEELKVAARRIAEHRDDEEIDTGIGDRKVLRAFFKGGQLRSIPATRSKRLVVLDVLAQSFEPGRRYDEKEVNKELSKFHEDVAALRRYLVDEGFMARSGGRYWRVGGSYPVA